MIIESIELKNYRNYGELHMDFSPGTNILYGDNAQGKTNVLEAVYVCSTTKSHRGSKDKESNDFHGNPFFVRSGAVNLKNLVHSGFTALLLYCFK